MVFELRQGASNVRCEDDSKARRRRIFKVCETAGVDETRMDKETAGDKKGQWFSAGSWRSKKVVDGRGRS